MAAETWINDSGTARRITEVWINDSGTARRITEIWVNDSGTARLIFAGAQIESFSGEINQVGTISFSLFSDGTRTNLDAEAGTNYWLEPQSGMSLFDVRATETSGSVTTGTVGSWLNLGTTRTWTKAPPGGPGASSVTLQLEIRRASDGVVLETNTIELVASA